MLLVLGLSGKNKTEADTTEQAQRERDAQDEALRHASGLPEKEIEVD